MTFKKYFLKTAAAVSAAAVLFQAGIQTADLNVFADDYSIMYDEYLSYRRIDEDNDGEYDYASISDCESRAVSVTIPSEIKGLPVKEIGEAAFKFTAIEKISVPESVIRICDDAFSYCKDLKSIEIPESVTEIGMNAFSFCESLTDAVLPKNLTEIKAGTFSNCTSVETVSIPEGVTSIGNSAFSDCPNLSEIILPDSLTSMGDSVFARCTGIKSIMIPENAEKLSDNIFYGCTLLTDINVSENNKNYCSVGGVLFSKDKTQLIRYPVGKTKTLYAVPDGIVKIVDEAFDSCDNLTKVILPESIE